MSSYSHGKSLCGRVSRKEFFASDANALATVRGIDLGSMRLKPCPVARKPLILCPSLLQLNWISYLFHDN